MDIVVTMPQQEIDHWNEKIEYSHIAGFRVWWNLKRWPKRLGIDDKVFIVMAGLVRGYFLIRSFSFGNPNKVFLRNFQEIKSIRMKGFQGFRYRKFDYEETE